MQSRRKSTSSALVAVAHPGARHLQRPVKGRIARSTFRRHVAHQPRAGDPLNALGTVPCGNSSLEVAPLTSGVAMFTDLESYLLTNTGQSTCSISGYPSVAVFHGEGGGNAYGQQVTVGAKDRVPNAPDGSPASDPTPPTLTLAPGDQAGFVVIYQADPQASAACQKQVTAFKITLPGISTVVSVPPESAFDVCPGKHLGDDLTISPILPASDVPHPSAKS
jgi:hypothetical protein